MRISRERFIGIRHRVKRTADDEARPTQVCVLDGKKPVRYELPDDTAELDWVLGKFPTSWRLAGKDENLSGFMSRHKVWKKVRKGTDLASLSENHQVKETKQGVFVLEVPTDYDGLREGDTVAMILGGSGDRLAYALSRRADEIGGRVMRIPAAKFKGWREDYFKRGKDDDDLSLAELTREDTSDFYEVTPRDRRLIELVEAYRARIDAMKARIGCEQRLRQLFIGRIFCSIDGKYPEGEIELLYDQEKANDAVYLALTKEESARESELKRLVESLDIFQRVFEPVEGMGPLIAARLIVAIKDIRRFASEAKLKAFLGVHVLAGGKFTDVPPEKQFPRRRGGLVANWHPDGRQALYLFMDQCVKRPDSVWGQKLREYKVKLRAAHPEPIKVNGKQRYGDGHIHKMALWRTATKFAEYLFDALTAEEKKLAKAA